MQLKTVDEVIRALGGTSEAAKALAVGLPVVSNWKARNKIPSSKYLVVNSLLRRRDCQAEPELFAFARPRGRQR